MNIILCLLGFVVRVFFLGLVIGRDFLEEIFFLFRFGVLCDYLCKVCEVLY